MKRDIPITFDSEEDAQRGHYLLLHGFGEVSMSMVHENVFMVNETELESLEINGIGFKIVEVLE